MIQRIIKKKEFVYPLGLIVIVFAVFSASVNYPILNGFDDNVYVLHNSHLALSLGNITYWFTHFRVGCYLPITMLSYMFDYNLWGLNGFGYHLQNIFWHIIATLAIYKCFTFFKIKPWIAFLLCLIFAIHPQRVESVVWISERKDVLCIAFYFWSIYFYIRNYDKKFSILAFAFFILALLSKPTAISLPIVLLAYEFYRHKGRIASATSIIRLFPYFLGLAIFIPISIIAQAGAIHSTAKVLSFHHLYLILHNIYWYFKQTIIPSELNPVYPLTHLFRCIVNLSLFYFSSLIIIFSLLLKKRKLLLHSVLPLILAYIGTLLPIIGLINLGSIDHADRYSYIPSAIVWFAIGLILTKLLNKQESAKNQSKKDYTTPFLLNKKFIFLILTIYSLILILLNLQYQKIWKSNYTLISYSASCSRASTAVLISLGDIELERGNYKNVLNVANQLEQKNKNSSMAAFFRASVMYRFDKKRAMKMLLKIEPAFKPQSNPNNDWNNRRRKILEMLNECPNYQQKPCPGPKEIKL